MKKNKYFKIISLIIILIFSITLITNFTYAAGKSVKGDLGSLDSYSGNDDATSDKLAEKAGTILGIISGVGVVVSIIALMLIGIKYMMGSVEEKAAYKETLKPYLIGAILLFSGSLIPSLIYNLADKIKV